MAIKQLSAMYDEEEPADVELLKKFTRLGLTKKDMEHYLEWVEEGAFEIRKTKGDMFLQLFRKLSKVIPSSVRTPLPPKIYRGLKVSDAQEANLKKGKVFKLKPKPLSSWTADEKEAWGYGDVVVFMKPNKNVLLYISPKLQKWLNMLNYYIAQKEDIKLDRFAHSHANEHEIIVAGSGVDKVDLSNCLFSDDN